MPAMQMVITVTEQGQVNVTGPLDNPLVAYGLLEVAKDTLRNHFAAAQQAAIKPATPEDVRTLRLTQ